MASPTDRVIQETNDDCTSSKAYAVRRGYWTDNYIKFFCPVPSQKSPEINRGYFARVQAFRSIVTTFIRDFAGKCQIVSLGAGSDTLYFQLLDSGLLPQKFVEIDLPHNVQRKIGIIRSQKLFGDIAEQLIPAAPSEGDSQALQHIEASGSNPPDIREPSKFDSHLKTDGYLLFSFDLRRPVDDLISMLCDPSSTPQMDLNIPTLFIAECVLVYMAALDSSQLLKGLSIQFSRAAFLHYEQVNMDDRFGSVMVRNFRARGCELPGLSACQSLRAQEERFKKAGWSNTKSWTMNQVYAAFSKKTRTRVEHVEMLDDLEIAQQLYEHYCILLATNDDTICPWNLLSEPLNNIS